MATSRSEIRITAEGWEGIFLWEEEAALALAGRPLPERILEHPAVPKTTRFKAASDPAYREDILGQGTSKVYIARWVNHNGLDVKDDSVSVELYRTPYRIDIEKLADPSTARDLARFRTATGGKSYNMIHTSTLIDCLLIAQRLAAAAEGNIQNRILALKIAEK